MARARKIATPGCLAVTAGRGKWKFAHHLQQLDRAVHKFILDNHRGVASARIMVIDAPPRHGKSEYCSHYLPAWFRGRFPDKHCFITSYESTFAAEWGAAARDVFSQPATDDDNGETIGDLFGLMIDPNAKHATRWKFVGHEGVTRTAGARGPMTGRGANLLIIDDPYKNDIDAHSPKIRQTTWNWFLSTAMTRVEPNGCVVLIATRWHREDISGRILDLSAKGEFEPVLHVHLPAISELGDPIPDSLNRPENVPLWPERFPLSDLLRTKRSQSTYWWNSMYQGRPTAAGIVDWPDSYFHDHIWCDDGKWPSDFALRVVFVDPALGKHKKPGDPAAIVFVGVKGNLVYVDAIVERMTTDALIGRTLSFLDTHHPDLIGFEANGFQEVLAEQFQRDTKKHFGVAYPIFMMTNTVNKILRIRRLDTYWRHSEFRFRRTPGCRTIIEQARDFPMGEHDDGLDSLECAIRLPIEAQFIKTR